MRVIVVTQQRTKQKTTRVCHIGIDTHPMQGAGRVCLTGMGDHFGYRPVTRIGRRASRTEPPGPVASVEVLFHWVGPPNGTKVVEYGVEARTFEGEPQRGVAQEPELLHVRGVDVHTDEPSTRRIARHKQNPRFVDNRRGLL